MPPSSGTALPRAQAAPDQSRLPGRGCPGRREAPGGQRPAVRPGCGPGRAHPGMVPDGPGRARLAAAPAAAFPQRRWKSEPATGGREGETAAAAPPSGERLGEAGVKSRISMRAGLMQITATGSSRRKAKQLQPGLPGSALQPGEA